MKTLLALRQTLRACEASYRTANGSLDEGNGTATVVAKQALKEARYAYHEALADAFEEQLAAHQCEEDWLNIKDVGLEKYPQEIIA